MPEDLWTIAAISFALYFLPAMVAALRRHHQSLAIFVTNLLLGWTLLGWVVALIWSCTQVQRPQQAVRTN